MQQINKQGGLWTWVNPAFQINCYMTLGLLLTVSGWAADYNECMPRENMLFFKLIKCLMACSFARKDSAMIYIYPEVSSTCIIDMLEMSTEEYQYFAIILCVIKWHKQLLQSPVPSAYTDRSLSHVIFQGMTNLHQVFWRDGQPDQISHHISPVAALNMTVNVYVGDIPSMSTLYCVPRIQPLQQWTSNTEDIL